MNANNVLNLQSRREIYSCVLKYPGIHLRQIFREIDHSSGSIRYNIDYLKRYDLIIEKKEDGYNRYYAHGKISKNEIETIKFLRNETPRNILLYVFCAIGASQKELSKELNKDTKTINFHLNKLIDARIIEPADIKNGQIIINYKKKKVFKRDINGRETIYKIRDPYMLYDLLIKYNDNLPENNNFIKSVLDFSEFFFYNNSSMALSDKHTVDKILDSLSEVFPPPYTL